MKQIVVEILNIAVAILIAYLFYLMIESDAPAYAVILMILVMALFTLWSGLYVLGLPLKEVNEK